MNFENKYAIFFHALSRCSNYLEGVHSGAALHQSRTVSQLVLESVVSTHYGNCVRLTLSLLIWFYRPISSVCYQPNVNVEDPFYRTNSEKAQ